MFNFALWNDWVLIFLSRTLCLFGDYFMLLKDLYNLKAEKLRLEVQALEMESLMIRRIISDAFLGYGDQPRLEEIYEALKILVSPQREFFPERKKLLKEAWSLLKKAENAVLEER